MRIELPNGKTVTIPVDKYLDMNDDEFNEHINYLMSINAGIDVFDPFDDIKVPSYQTLDNEQQEIEELPEEELQRLKEEFKKG